MSKKPFFFSLLVIMSMAFSFCRIFEGEGSGEKKYLFLGHCYDWNAPADDRVDPRVEQLPLSEFDQIWLGGDLCARTSEKASTLDYLDKIFDLGSTHTHWTLGNHDVEQQNIYLITAKTGRNTFYSSCFDGICILVMNTNLFYHPNSYPVEASCRQKHKQTELIKTLTDTLTEASHLIVLHHYGLLTDRIASDSLQVNRIFHYHHPELLVDCESRATFEEVYFPLFRKVQERGVQVIMVSGDVGQRIKEFAYQTREGIWFLGSGINNSCGRETAPPWVTNFDADKLLIFTHRPEKKELKWRFVELNGLVGK